ncbi:hypothetical protein [Pukyongia salina]|nr:hypothetical protein [Pukyongia salina]
MNIARNIHTIMKQEWQRKDLFQLKQMQDAFMRTDMAMPGKPYIS